MTVLDIIQPDNPVLRRKARRVTSFDRRFQKLVDDMIETMQEAKGIGLAAPQVAVSQRVFVARLPDDSEEAREEFGEQAGVLYVIVNPKLLRVSKETKEGVEGCLSIPGFIGDVERPVAVTIRGQDRHGKALRVRAEGWLARVFQHEFDHLNGTLFIDIATDVRPIEDEEGEEDETNEDDTTV
ncbi:MAG: peptide deformylase [Anaerolineaceae bacterium]|nr:peptide deformylase [Anaerolineaceae bacterium]